MFKKYFAMTIIAASVSLAACSDDDDDNGDGGNGGNGGGGTAVTATPGVGGTAFDTVVNSDDHTILEAAIIAADLADTLDDPASAYTIFAPTDAAFAVVEVGDPAAPVTVDTVGQVPGLDRILKYHVIGSAVSAEAVSGILNDGDDATNAVETLLVDAAGTDQEITQTVELALSASSSAGVSVGGVDLTLTDVTILGTDEVEGETPEIGTVHVIGSLLTPPDAPEVPDPEPSPAPTGALADLVGTDYNIAVAALDNTYSPGAFEGAPWTLFLPTDATLAAAGITQLTAAQINGHLSTQSFDEAALAALIGTSIQSATGEGVAQTIEITDDGAGNPLVGGFPVTYIGQVAGASGAQVYMIDGILPAAE